MGETVRRDANLKRSSLCGQELLSAHLATLKPHGRPSRQLADPVCRAKY